MRPYLLSRAGLIDFYHRNLFKAVRERYLPSEEQRRQAHGRLAKYFNAQDYWLESLEEQQIRARTLPPTPRPANVRKVDELPWQLLQAADWQKSEQLLTDLPFLEAKAEAGMVFDLAADFSAATGGMPTDRPLLRILRLLEEALRRDIHFIARHPTTLFQCLWNSCWWYDCPEAAEHYESPEGGWPPGGPVWVQAGPKLSELLATWRTAKEGLTPGFPWIRSVRPPPIHLGTAQRAVLRGHLDHGDSVAFLPDGRRIVSGAWDETVRVWDLTDGAELLCLGGHEGQVWSVACAPDGRRIVSAAGHRFYIGEVVREDATVRVWDVDCANEIICFRGHEDGVTGVAFSPDGRSIVSGGWDKAVRVWDATSGLELCCLRSHQGQVTSVAYAPHGDRIVSAGRDEEHAECNTIEDRTVRVWDVHSGKELVCLQGHEDGVTAVAFSPDGRRIASGSTDRTVRIWDVYRGEELACLRGHGDEVTAVAFSPDGCRIASGSEDRTVRVWDVDSGRELVCLRGHEDSVTSVAFATNGQLIASASGDKTIRIWEANSDLPLAYLRDHPTSLSDIIFSPNGQHIVSLCYGSAARVWCTGTGLETAHFPYYSDRLESHVFSWDGQRFAIGLSDTTVRICDVDSGKELACLRGHEDSVTGVAFSPDGRSIASGSTDRTVRIWDLYRRKELACLRGHDNEVRRIAFSQDGQLVAAESRGTLRIWNLLRREEVACVHCFHDFVDSIAFSPDGHRLVAKSYRIVTGLIRVQHTVQVWNVSTQSCLEVIKRDSDIETIATGMPEVRRFVLERELGTTIKSTITGEAVGWLSAELRHVVTHPSGRAWAGNSLAGHHLCLFTLEP